MQISIVGGAGHVGLPFGILLAHRKPDWHVDLYDTNEQAVQCILSGHMPFLEQGIEPLLQASIGKNLRATTDISVIGQADIVVIVIGTPIDEHLNPVYSTFYRFIDEVQPYLKDQVLLLRSTVYPGSTRNLHRYLQKRNLRVHLGYCPERIAEGKALDELTDLPQIISGCSERAVAAARELFSALTDDIIELAPLEAELAKLFTNSWRYIQFATANQFYTLAQSHGVDFYRIYHAITHKYPRAVGFPRAGFTAGPCLLKDTMQLSAFARNQFFLGHAAMLINEGLPRFLVDQMKKDFADLNNRSVGILGMAFKGESDDSRDSLSYKLRKILQFEASVVYCSDEYIDDREFIPAQQLLDKSDIVVVGAPHKRYREVLQGIDKPLYDVWNMA